MYLIFPFTNLENSSIINGIDSGKATNNINGNSQFREFGNKLKDVLVNQEGYKWNPSGETGNNRVVLWQTSTGGNHYNHLHISNTTNVALGYRYPGFKYI